MKGFVSGDLTYCIGKKIQISPLLSVFTYRNIVCKGRKIRISHIHKRKVHVNL